MIDKKPEIIVFAGPNGSGKSTITSLFLPLENYVNADEIKKHSKCTDIEAAIMAEKQREEFIQKKENFSFETVLSTERNLNLLKKAKEQGYFLNYSRLKSRDSNYLLKASENT